MNSTMILKALIVLNHFENVTNAAIPRAANITEGVGFRKIPDDTERLPPKCVADLFALVNPTGKASWTVTDPAIACLWQELGWGPGDSHRRDRHGAPRPPRRPGPAGRRRPEPRGRPRLSGSAHRIPRPLPAPLPPHRAAGQCHARPPRAP